MRKSNYNMNTIRRFRKHLSLRMVNIAGLSVMFACLLLSAGYIKHEMSYDRHHANADRIVRMTLQVGDEPVDGRIWGNTLFPVLQQIPEIEQTVKVFNVYSAVLTYNGRNHTVNNFFEVNPQFLQVFDLPLLYGDKDHALQRHGQIMLSESYARQLFGELDFDAIQLSEISIEGRNTNHGPGFVSAIFKDMPETSHFHTDILLYMPDDLNGFIYTYLLLKQPTDIQALAQKITRLAEENELFQSANTQVKLMPLTDIHLYSHNLRELDVNGNAYYIYLVIGANLLLLIVVLFNLWLNASLIFSHNRRYYQILRLHGASPSVVIGHEAWSALWVGFLAVIIGILAAFYITAAGYLSGQISFIETVALILVFMLSIIAVSILPALRGISFTLFLNSYSDLRPVRFSYSNVKWMLTAQYAVVMIVVILAFGINKQMNLVHDTQVGGNERNILVLNEQPDPVQATYSLLKAELQKHPEIEAVTSSFQIPGNAIRDHIGVRKENDPELKILPIMVAGEDFLPFFHIDLVAGRGFSPAKYDFQTEGKLFYDRITNQNFSDYMEEYILNSKALAVLGYHTPDEALGEILQLEHGTLDYFRSGVIVGVTGDYNYTGLYEETIPLLMMQRNTFQHCLMVRLAPGRLLQAREVFDKVWNEVNPEYPAKYVFMNDVFDRMYRNEINAQQLVYVFSLLCFLVADLGLIVFMSSIIRRRTREIGIRKVFGASVSSILQLLNTDFFRYVTVAFVVAVPVARYVMLRWLERFAYRTSLDWWIFALAGLSVLFLSVISISLQSWRAATSNPVDAIRNQ